MKNLIGIGFVIGLGVMSGCSDGGKMAVSGSGGTTSAVGGSSSTGGSVPNVNATEVPEKEWGTENGGATSGTFVGSDLFGDLPELQNGDPCMKVVPWHSGVDTKIVNGDLVSDSGKVYKYDTSNSSCNESITYTFDACVPSAPATWCAPCWILQPDLTCTDSTTTATTTETETTPDGGIGIEKDAG